MHYLGVRFDFPRFSRKAFLGLKALDFHPELKFRLDLMLNEWERICIDIASCEERLAQQSSQDENETIYRSIPGIGKTIARVLANELGDMSQFSNEKQLFSYCGLTPCEYSSGEKIYRGHITRQGKACLRMYLTQAAWRAIRKDKALEEAFMRIGAKAGSKRAIQAIARKLIGRVRACLVNKQKYELGKN
jgi:transposase